VHARVLHMKEGHPDICLLAAPEICLLAAMPLCDIHLDFDCRPPNIFFFLPTIFSMPCSSTAKSCLSQRRLPPAATFLRSLLPKSRASLTTWPRRCAKWQDPRAVQATCAMAAWLISVCQAGTAIRQHSRGLWRTSAFPPMRPRGRRRPRGSLHARCPPSTPVCLWGWRRRRLRCISTGAGSRFAHCRRTSGRWCRWTRIRRRPPPRRPPAGGRLDARSRRSLGPPAALHVAWPWAECPVGGFCLGFVAGLGAGGRMGGRIDVCRTVQVVHGSSWEATITARKGGGGRCGQDRWEFWGPAEERSLRNAESAGGAGFGAVPALL
jgi:hypothetical protein